MRPKLPVRGDGKSEIAEYNRFLKWGCNNNASVRRGHFITWEQCRLYPIGEQWLEDGGDDFDSRVGYGPALRPKQVDSNDWFPMPVQNEIAAPLQNEIARLMGAGSKPYIRPSKSDSRRVKAAEMGRDVLNNRLNELCWVDKQHRGISSAVQYGTAIWKSWWELDYTDMLTVPKSGINRCPACGAVHAGLTAPYAMAAQFIGSNPAAVDRVAFAAEGQDVSITGCLSCGSGLEPFLPEAGQLSSLDVLGRPLGDQVPRGDTAVSVVAVYDWYPENLGIGTEDEKCLEWFEERIESIDWIASHYFEGYKVKPSQSIDVAKFHPCVGSTAGYNGGDRKDGIFEHHEVVREFHKKPWVEVDEKGNRTLNRGRSIVVAGNTLLLDDDYMVESGNNPGTLIPRVVYASVPWELRDREIWGISATEYSFSAQDTINTTLSQVQDARHRMGSPKWLVESGMNLGFAGGPDTGIDSNILEYTPGQKADRPIEIGNVQMAQNWVVEVDGARDSINRAIGTMDVEVGQAPGKDLTAASAIMYLGEKAAERRKPRIERIKRAKRQIYRHQLQMIHEFYREDRQYAAWGRNDKWTIRCFRGADLMGESDVQFDDEPYYDVRMFRREVVKDGIQLGTISIDTADAKRKINKELGIPLEINSEQNQQVAWAEEEWFQFFEEGRAPAMSQRSDDPIIHYQSHELSLRSDEGRQLMASCGWSDAELLLWGWEDKLEALEAIEQQLKQPAPLAPVGPPGLDGQPGDPTPEAAQVYAEGLAQRAQMEQQVQQFPKAPELRVALIWAQMLAPFLETLGQDPGRAQGIGRVLRWRAHIEAHFQEAQKRAIASQAGLPIPAAPGAAETSAGLQPTPGQVSFPGAGAGPGATTASGGGGANV